MRELRVSWKHWRPGALARCVKCEMLLHRNFAHRDGI